MQQETDGEVCVTTASGSSSVLLLQQQQQQQQQQQDQGQQQNYYNLSCNSSSGFSSCPGGAWGPSSLQETTTTAAATTTTDSSLSRAASLRAVRQWRRRRQRNLSQIIVKTKHEDAQSVEHSNNNQDKVFSVSLGQGSTSVVVVQEEKEEEEVYKAGSVSSDATGSKCLLRLGDQDANRAMAATPEAPRTEYECQDLSMWLDEVESVSSGDEVVTWRCTGGGGGKNVQKRRRRRRRRKKKDGMKRRLENLAVSVCCTVICSQCACAKSFCIAYGHGNCGLLISLPIQLILVQRCYCCCYYYSIF